MWHYFIDNKEAFFSAWVWSMLHTLWIGLVLALVFYFILQSQQRYSAHTKYVIGVFLLAILPIAAISIFIYLSPSWIDRAVIADAQLYKMDKFYIPATTISLPLVWTDIIFKYAGSIFNIWLLGIAVLSLRMLVGYRDLQLIKTKSYKITDQNIVHIFQNILSKSKLTQDIRLVQNASIQNPSTFGFLKPWIVLPISVINHLSLEETYAVLAHEVAHIIRKDYLQNIFISFVEILFFFHPSVWWFSSTLKSLREQCCDDLALSLGAEKMALSKALVQLEENQLSPTIAMAFSHKHQLLNRIQRIFNPNMKNEFTIQRGQAPILVCSLALLCMMARPIADFTKDENKISLLRSFLWEPKVIADTTKPKSKIEKISKDNGKEKVELKLKDKEIEELKINDKVIPKEDYIRYEEKTKELKKELKEIETDQRGVHIYGDTRSIFGKRFAFEGNGLGKALSGRSPRVYSFAAPLDKKSFGFHLDNDQEQYFLSPRSKVITKVKNRINYEIIGDSTKIVVDGDNLIIRGEKGDVYIDLRERGGAHVFNLGDGLGFASGYNWAFPKLELKELKELGAIGKNERWEEIDGQWKKLHEDKYRELERFKDEWENKAEELLELREEKLEKITESKERARELKAKEFSRSSEFRDRALKERTKITKLNKAIQEKLLEDKIISPGDNYEIKIDKNGLRINGKKQPDSIFQEFKTLIEENSGFEITGDTNFNFNGTTDK